MEISNKKILKQEMKRITIIQAAKELFLEQRYSSITMDVIARRAGITKRTLYAYFPSKLALFIHLFDEYLQHLLQQVTKSAKQDLPAKELIVSLFTALFEFTRDNEKFMRLYWTLDSNEFDGLIPEELMSRIRIWTKAIFEESRMVMEKAKSEGVLSPGLSTELVIHLMSAMNKGIFIHTSKENKFEIANVDPGKLFQVASDTLTRGLFLYAS
ncbi:MAG TPA: TetR/AcrR family transcriptional regulator [Deltaproteobacteria bacterium]|nr:TetR/AcrR family transcriptional regulator [Deltaproteobacteria bacterium]HPR53711.1 TetR/AcrR family transcriptional regulator [Deltaproteobacteria bacterium]HXK47577.1 TetR/AcrR family transcriptional regulator [Deltaproteobacteria bacterium]